MQLVCVVESVAGFVAEIHHDLAIFFKVVHISLDLGQVWPREIKRDSDDRFARRASPLISQINCRTKLNDLLSFELAVKLLDQLLDRRALDLQAKVANPGFQQRW